MTNIVTWDTLSDRQRATLQKANRQLTLFCGQYGEANRATCLSLTKYGLMHHLTINTFEISEAGRAIIPNGNIETLPNLAGLPDFFHALAAVAKVQLDIETRLRPNPEEWQAIWDLETKYGSEQDDMYFESGRGRNYKR